MKTDARKVLLVHEEIEILNPIFCALVSEGCSVGLTTCVATALQILEDHTFDVAAVSSNMQFGVETMLHEMLYVRFPRLPLVLFTDDHTTARVLALLKGPFDPRQIADGHDASDRCGPELAQLL
jgi:DNA-binding NtrC family response regulator